MLYSSHVQPQEFSPLARTDNGDTFSEGEEIRSARESAVAGNSLQKIEIHQWQ
jgi:hypothetical protein